MRLLFSSCWGLTWLWLLQVLDCRIVLLVGLSLMIVPVAVMCCFNDDRSLGESSEAKRCELGCFLQHMLCPSNLPLSGDCPLLHRLWHSYNPPGSSHKDRTACAHASTPAYSLCSWCSPPKRERPATGVS